MAGDDWFRNKSWNAEIEAAFLQKLRRARDKAQYLCIQASYLAQNHPQAALGLLQHYFTLDDKANRAGAHGTRAEALVALGDLDGAVAAYEAALDHEREYTFVRTEAYLDLACLVVERDLLPRYPRALEILDAHAKAPLFSYQRHRAHGARAIILHHLGLVEEARAFAKLAMAAAAETQSGFRYHQRVGLVEDPDSDFARRVARIAQ